jgi:hypothetical protein
MHSSAVSGSGTLTHAPICTARALPFVCAAACREGAVARSGKKRAHPLRVGDTRRLRPQEVSDWRLDRRDVASAPIGHDRQDRQSRSADSLIVDHLVKTRGVDPDARLDDASISISRSRHSYLRARRAHWRDAGAPS